MQSFNCANLSALFFKIEEGLPPKAGRRLQTLPLLPQRASFPKPILNTNKGSVLIYSDKGVCFNYGGKVIEGQKKFSNPFSALVSPEAYCPKLIKKEVVFLLQVLVGCTSYFTRTLYTFGQN
jgi:hypothetical protein